MFTPLDLIEYVVVVVALVFSAAFYVFVLRRRRVEDFRCPGCNFLVNIKDVKQYGYVCPDCRTDWRVHPLKDDEDEEIEASPEKGRNQRNRSLPVSQRSGW